MIALVLNKVGRLKFINKIVPISEYGCVLRGEREWDNVHRVNGMERYPVISLWKMVFIASRKCRKMYSVVYILFICFICCSSFQQLHIGCTHSITITDCLYAMHIHSEWNTKTLPFSQYYVARLVCWFAIDYFTSKCSQFWKIVEIFALNVEF